MSESILKTNDLLARVLDGLANVVGGVRESQLRDPTPCTEFDVETLRNHILGWLTTFAAGYADPAGRAPASTEGYQPSPDLAADVRSAAAQLTEAVRQGAAERPLYLGESAMPGELALGMVLWEYLVHGWDLARATGRAWAPPEEAAAEALAFAPAMLTDDYQGVGKPFAPRVAVPADASSLDKLLGLSGRDPQWAAAASAGSR